MKSHARQWGTSSWVCIGICKRYRAHWPVVPKLHCYSWIGPYWNVDVNQARRLCRPLAQHNCISHHFPERVPFIRIYAKHTLSYNLQLLHCLTYSTRQRSLKDLVPVDFKLKETSRQRGVGRSRNLEIIRNNHIVIFLHSLLTNHCTQLQIQSLRDDRKSWTRAFAGSSQWWGFSGGWWSAPFSSTDQLYQRDNSEAKHHWPGRGGPEGTGTVSFWGELLNFYDRFRRYPGYTSGLYVIDSRH